MDDGFTVVGRRSVPTAAAAPPPAKAPMSPYANAGAAIAPLARYANRAGPTGYDFKEVEALRKEMLAALLPYAVKVEEPIQTRTFIDASAAVLVPLLRRTAPGLEEGRFRTLWGQCLPFVSKQLAAQKGLKGLFYDTGSKTTNLYIDAPGAPLPVSAAAAAAADAAAMGAAGAAGTSSGGSAGPAFTLAVAHAAASAGAARASASRAHWCVFCGAEQHLMGTCPQFRQMLEAVFAAGVVAGRRQQALPAAVTAAAAAAPSAPFAGLAGANGWAVLTQQAVASMQAAMPPSTGVQPGPATPPEQLQLQGSGASAVVAPSPVVPDHPGSSGAMQDSPALCMLCGLHPPSGILIPCGHTAACSGCAAGLADDGSSQCPLCHCQVECVL